MITVTAGPHGPPVILDDQGEVMEPAAGIKALRKARGLSAQQFADMLGVSRRTLEGWEQGRPVSVLVLRAIQTVV